MDNVNLLDLSFKKVFGLRGSGMRLEPRVDIYNLLNGATVTDRIQQLGPQLPQRHRVAGRSHDQTGSELQLVGVTR